MISLVTERSPSDKKNQRQVALIFLIRIRILIVRNINFSVIKDIPSGNMLYLFEKKFLEDAERVSDLYIAFRNDDRTPSRFVV